MKKKYLKPQIIVQNINVKNYILNSSDTTSDPPVPQSNIEVASIWSRQLSKDRNEIWDSGSDDEGIW